MRTYYRGLDAVVTNHSFIWLHDGATIFALAELRDITRERRENGRLIRFGPKARRIRRRAIPAALLACVGAGWVLLDLPGIWVVAIGLLAAALLGVLRPPPTSWALTAAYRDQEKVTIYRTSDPYAFRRVCRALVRALEDPHQG